MGFLEELLLRVDLSVQNSNFTLENLGRGSRWSHLRNANAVWHLLAHCLSSADSRIHEDAVIMDQRHSECSERVPVPVEPHFGGLRLCWVCSWPYWSRSHLFPLSLFVSKASPTASLHACIPTTKQLPECSAWWWAWPPWEVQLSFWCCHSWNHPMIQPHIWNIPSGSTVIFKGGDMLEQQKWWTWSPMASE